MTRYIVVLIAFIGLAGIVPRYFERHEDRTRQVSAPVTADSAQEGSSRPALPAARYLGNARVATLQPNAQGHFTGRFELNGEEVEGIIDTGATDVAMNLSMARRIGIAVAPSDFVHTVQTANGETKAASAILDSVRIDGVMENDVPAIILPDSAMPQTLIGMSFLGRLHSYQVHDGVLDLKE